MCRKFFNTCIYDLDKVLFKTRKFSNCIFMIKKWHIFNIMEYSEMYRVYYISEICYGIHKLNQLKSNSNIYNEVGINHIE